MTRDPKKRVESKGIGTPSFGLYSFGNVQVDILILVLMLVPPGIRMHAKIKIPAVKRIKLRPLSGCLL